MSNNLSLVRFNISLNRITAELPVNIQGKRVVVKIYVDTVKLLEKSVGNVSGNYVDCALHKAPVIAINKFSVLSVNVSGKHRIHKDATLAVFSVPATDLLQKAEESEDYSVNQAGSVLTLSCTFKEESLNDAAKKLFENKRGLVASLKGKKEIVDNLLEIISTVSQLNPYASIVSALVTTIWNKCTRIFDLDDTLTKLLNDIIDFLPDLCSINDHANLDLLKETITDLEKAIKNAIIFIEHYQASNQVVLALQSIYSGSSADQASAISKDVSSLKGKLQERMQIQIFRQVDQIDQKTTAASRTLNVVEQKLSDATQKISFADEKLLLDILKPVPGANSDHPHNSCLKDTRVAVINLICDWVHSSDSTRLFWLNGLPGVGKSTIACSTLESLNASDVQTESFFCQRLNSKYNQGKIVIQTVIYYLACHLPSFRDPLLAKIREVKGHDTTTYVHYSTELKKIVSASLKAAASQRTAVILIDALDECLNGKEQIKLLSELLLLTQQCGWLKVIVTSRPYQNIEQFFADKGQCSFTLSIDYNVSDSNSLNSYGDLLVYAEHSIEELVQVGSFSHPGRHVVLRLVEKARGLFQWMTVAVQFLADSVNTEKALEMLLKRHSEVEAMDELYCLYKILLAECIKLEKGSNAKACSKVLGLLAVLKSPLPPNVMQKFVMDCNERTIEGVCSRLHSVITQSQDGTIAIAHQSFADYLSSSHDLFPGQLQIDLMSINANVASLNLDIMLSNLRFNICKLETSARFNRDIPNLEDRLENYISKELLYSCLNWLDHSSQSGVEDERIQKLLGTEKLLFWLEVLSLTGQTGIGKGLSKLQVAKDTKTLVEETMHFLKYFIIPISWSTPHLYLSALAFTPKNSPIYKYNLQFKHLITVQKGFEEQWNSSTVLIMQITTPVNAVAFAPDGKKIVSGSDDKTVRIWNAETGQQNGNPLSGHSAGVGSVAYSPDGKIVVSGSHDKTVRIWNAETGHQIGEPLSGHSGTVRSVAYSPDGKRIVSGSDGKTIRIWDAQTGQQIGEPFSGHSGTVWSVAYSPDRERTVPETEIMWVVEEHQSDRSGWMQCVAYSPDGKRIVSGSHDRTIRIWGTQTGQQIGEPLSGHSAGVGSVAYSPDGKRIVSGSHDKTVRIWDAEMGHQIGEPLSGHSDWVMSVAYSPDGKSIVSGSNDSTMRIWNAGVSKQIQSTPLGLANISDCKGRDIRLSVNPTNEFQIMSSVLAGNTDVHVLQLACRKLNQDGWAFLDSDKEQPAFWVPNSLISSVKSGSILCISKYKSDESVILDFSDFSYGEKWQEIY